MLSYLTQNNHYYFNKKIKTMKNLFLSIMTILFSANLLIAQSIRHEVTVYISDKKTEEAMMTVNERAPWDMQKTIAIYDKSLKDEKRIKNKQKTKYKAKDIKGFEVDGRKYVSKKVLMPAGTYGGTLKSLPNYAFIEVIEEGPISVYRGYSYPPGVVSGVTLDEVYADIRSNPNYFVIKAESKKPKLKDINLINIEKWVSDAPEVSKKLAEGEYGNFKRKEGKKMMNFIKGQIENENPSLIVDIIRDYNLEKTGK